MIRTPLLMAAIGACLALAACGNNLRDEELEDQLTGLAASELRGFVKPEEIAVDCPDDIQADIGLEFECAITAGSESGVVRGRITHEDGGYRYLGIDVSGGRGGEAEPALPGDAK